MRRLLIGALVAACAVAAPALGQNRGAGPVLKLVPLVEPVPLPNRFSLDVAREPPAPVRGKGARLLVGTEVAPGATLGLGLFNGAPKRRVGEERFELHPKTSRKAGVGLVMKF